MYRTYTGKLWLGWPSEICLLNLQNRFQAQRFQRSVHRSPGLGSGYTACCSTCPLSLQASEKNTMNIWHQKYLIFGFNIFFKNLFCLTLFRDLGIILEMFVQVQVCTWKTPRIRSLICFNPRDLRTHHRGRQFSRTEGVTTPNPKQIID